VPKKYLNNVEKISKIDNSCPKSFQRKITNPSLDDLVAKTIEDEDIFSPPVLNNATEYTFDNR
jgi:hypothetical protein